MRSLSDRNMSRISETITVSTLKPGLLPAEISAPVQLIDESCPPPYGLRLIRHDLGHTATRTQHPRVNAPLTQRPITPHYVVEISCPPLRRPTSVPREN